MLEALLSLVSLTSLYLYCFDSVSRRISNAAVAAISVIRAALIELLRSLVNFNR
jgi:hypothetical protein